MDGTHLEIEENYFKLEAQKILSPNECPNLSHSRTFPYRYDAGVSVTHVDDDSILSTVSNQGKKLLGYKHSEDRLV